MRIPYARFVVRGPRGSDLVEIFRPLVRIRVCGPSGAHEVLGWVDTGSDDTLFPESLSTPLGLSGSSLGRAVIAGIGGAAIVRYEEVDLQLGRRGPSYRWSARVGFHAGHQVVLGHAGFLEYFTATFNGRQRHLTLLPNATAPPQTPRALKRPARSEADPADRT